MNDYLLEVEPTDEPTAEEAPGRRCHNCGAPSGRWARCPIHRAVERAREQVRQGRGRRTEPEPPTFADYERDQRARGRR